MKLKQLASLRRFRRTAEIFRHPVTVHLHVAAARHRPLTADFVHGGSLRVSDVRQCRPIFDWLLEQCSDPSPVTGEGGLIEFNYRGRRMGLRPNHMDFLIFKEIFAEDQYGLDATDGPLATVVDIGANVGLFAVRVAPMAERVICVEPVAANLAAARQYLARAKVAEKVVLRKSAVTGRSGATVRVFLSCGNSGGHSIRREHAGRWGAVGSEDVPAISLAELFDSEGVHDCSLLKCDVEGSEFEIFQTAPREILSRINRIVMEVHFTVGDWNQQQFAGLCNKLSSAGFRLEHDPIRDRRGRLKPVLQLVAQREQRAQRLVA